MTANAASIAVLQCKRHDALTRVDSLKAERTAAKNRLDKMMQYSDDFAAAITALGGDPSPAACAAAAEENQRKISTS